MGEQDAAQWSAASPVGAYLKTLGTALAQLQSGLVAMHDTVEAQAEALEGTAAPPYGAGRGCGGLALRGGCALGLRWHVDPCASRC